MNNSAPAIVQKLPGATPTTLCSHFAARGRDSGAATPPVAAGVDAPS
ncbi:MAG: hypothetical protein H6659_00875 [Ardenticatenaceae bacterium]|nr:hypothetical protein [Ardenticatenaceae bacterium]